MKSIDNVGITFVNLVLSQGHLNGNVNLTLGAYQFTPNEEKKKVEVDAVVVSRLRMDEQCATHLRDVLTQTLELMAKARDDAAVPGSGNGLGTPAPKAH